MVERLFFFMCMDNDNIARGFLLVCVLFSSVYFVVGGLLLLIWRKVGMCFKIT